MPVISKVLIANRSEIARRVMRTCAEMGIASVAVFAEHDAGAVFVQDADEAVALPSGSSYLDISAIVRAAQHTGAQAIHPGYGFLAENASFAEAVEAAGIIFIGPAPETIALMGSKLRARGIVASAGVPVLPIAGVGDGVDVQAEGEGIGYPLLVKASSGGGGKGMRIVSDPSALEAAIESAEREAESTFGDGTVYLERYVTQPRHIEVQILGDGQGNVVHLYERECSIQRRFQKILEESPAPNLDPELKQALWKGAVAAGAAVDYRGAGTVEFIVDSGGDFAFLEMNTRLQVEHPVTEMTTGVDLVRLQIELAAGGSLLTQSGVPPQVGHAIEARVNAESPADGYIPSTGTVHTFEVPGRVRVDSGVADGATITHHYDPLIAKVISHAPTRDEAARVLAKALTGSRIHGITTNRDLLVRVLRHGEFLAGGVDTDFLDREGDVLTMPLVDGEVVRSMAAVAALGLQAKNREEAVVLGSVPSGWRNVRFQRQSLAIMYGDRPLEVSYRASPNVTEVAVDGLEVAIDGVYRVSPSSVDIDIDGVRMVYSVNVTDGEIYVDSSLGSARFGRVPRFPVVGAAVVAGRMVAATPGMVVVVPVSVGDTVREGDPVMVIEAMKMEQAVVAPDAGRVTAVFFSVGEQVDAGSVLVEIDSEDRGG